jgi:hypothetical protein
LRGSASVRKDVSGEVACGGSSAGEDSTLAIVRRFEMDFAFFES